MQIREATDADWAAIWPFLRAIVADGETYPYDVDLPEGFCHPQHGYVGLHIMYRPL